MRFSIEKLKLEREDVQEDLRGLKLAPLALRVGDFGCGWGYTTLSLMLELQTFECFGVDRFTKNLVLDVPSIEDVNLQFNELREEVLSNAYPPEEHNIKSEIHQILQNSPFPKFQVGDVVTGDNLPSNLDFIYCKKLLQNIFDGGFNQYHKGDEGVNLAINRIFHAVKQDGVICIVEPAGTNFMPFLEQNGLEMIRCCRIQRNRISGQKRSTIIKEQYLLYHYKKP
ncbi:MAG: hypothetical protein DCC56_05750 [Anaerolineae bacterium]|nr:MAG: hypothetical protein DCC56_05750 [Anaerolineae bacterium]WKZ43642.1 MAG: hypothetical protein QY302_16230 [Anaerolineales bacterium]